MSSQPPNPSDPPAKAPQSSPRTNTDGFRSEIWLGDDPVVQLRDWASDEVHVLPEDGSAECVIGRDPAAGLRLLDHDDLISRMHARLKRGGPFWYLEDMNSKNGIRVDNERGNNVMIAPGQEIGIGGLTLVAENRSLIRLRGYLARVLGWKDTNRDINLAVRAIRAAANRRAPLVIAGADDVMAVARQIHRRAMPPTAPFVICGPASREPDISVGIRAIHPDATAAVRMACRGTVCVRADDLPPDFDWLVKTSKERRGPVQLFICASKAPRRRTEAAPPLTIPALAGRSQADVERIVAEYAADAIAELQAAPASFTERHHEWVTLQSARSFAEIEIATLRIVAFHDAGNVHRAAARLGLSHVALGKWLAHRNLR
jgi:FHA domain